MTQDDGVIRSVSWRDLCPWTILFRLYRHAVSVQILALAFFGVWTTAVGWQVAKAVCLGDETQELPSVQHFMECVSDWPESIFWRTPGDVAEQTTVGELAASEVRSVSTKPTESMLASFWHDRLGRTPLYAIMEPVRRWFDPTISWDAFAFYLVGGLWSLLVWSLIGGAITRTAAVRLGRDERVGLRESLEFSSRKLLSILGAPLLPLIAIFALGIPLAILGLLMRLDLGVVIAGVLWLPVGLIGFSMTLFAIGVMFGWPLMWSTICTEGSDSFDAISRSYAYTYQRPLQYLFYATLALVLGFLGWIIVGLFCQSIIQLSLLAVGAGTGEERMKTLLDTLVRTQESGSSLLGFGISAISFFNRCILGIQVAFGYSFLWTAAAAIYLLLRQDADRTEMDDVYLEDDSGVRYGLPPLTVDDVGVPGVDENEAAAPSAVKPDDPPAAQTNDEE